MKRTYAPPRVTTHGDIRDLTNGRWKWGDGDGVFIWKIEMPLAS